MNLIEHRVHDGLAFADDKARGKVERAVEDLEAFYKSVWPLADRRRSRDVGAPSWWDDDAEADEALALAARIGTQGW